MSSLIPGDLRMLRNMERETKLRRVMEEEETVNISNPVSGGLWEAVKIIALASHPVMLIEYTVNSPGAEKGKRWMLPQAFEVEPFVAKIRGGRGDL